MSDKNLGPIQQLFLDNGTEEKSGGNVPIQLDNQDAVWFVSEGNLDIFGMDTQSKRREFVCGFSKGGIVFGQNTKTKSNYTFLGVGRLDTQVYKMSKDDFYNSFSKQKFSKKNDRIISNLEIFSNSFPEITRPQFSQVLKPGDSISSKKSDVSGIHKENVWIKVEHGVFAINGIKNQLLDEKSSYFPVIEGAWLECTVDGSLSVLGSDASLSTKDFRHGVEQWVHSFYLWAAEEIDNLIKIDNYKIDDRIKFEKSFNANAIKNLSDIMEKETDEDSGKYTGDPFFKLFHEIGKLIDIEFKQPPRWQTPWLWKRASRGTETVKTDDYSDPIKIISQHSKIRYRQVVLNTNWWEEDSGPFLGFFKNDERNPIGKMQHAVALLPQAPGQYYIYNSREETRTPVTIDELKKLDGIAYVFYRPFNAIKLKFKEFLNFVKPEIKVDLKLIFLTGIAGFLLGLVQPMVTAHLFNAVIPNADLGQLWQMFILLIVVTVSGILFNVTQGWSQMRMESKINSSLQIAVFDRIMKLPLPFFRKYPAGDLAMRATGINKVRAALGGATMTSIFTSMEGLGSIIMLFYYSTKLASNPQGSAMSGALMLVAVGLIILAINITFTVICSIKILKIQRNVQKVEGQVSGLVLQLLSSIAKLRVSGMESRAFSVWAKKFKEQNKFSFISGRIGNFVSVYNLVIPTLSSIVYYYMISFLYGSSGAAISTGYFMAFFTSFTGFMASITGLTSTLVGLINVIPAIERSKPIIETAPEINENADTPGPLKGEIEVRNLCFRYKVDGPLILDEVSLKSEPGEFLALVGPSGSGKSTLLKMLLGFEHPESGAVYYDEQELAGLDVSAVRQQIGVVTQESGVLSGSIFQNIIGASNRSLDDAWEAAEMAGLNEDIDNMPMGMNTVVSEGGSTLSGGQRQRLLIARALIKKPRLIFFDEATSALDNHTQKIVSDSLDLLNASRIVVAHRLSTIQNADTILVLEKGVITESGNFDELMKLNGMFARLASRQMA